MAANIDEQLANYRQLRAIIVDSLADTDAKIDHLIKAKQILDQEVTVAITKYDGHQNPSEFIPTQAAVQRIQQPDVDVSIVAGCANIPEAMFAWAEANDGKLDGKELAPVLRKSGLSKAKNDESAMATITNFAVRAYADYWIKTGPNQFERKHPATDTVPDPDQNVQDPDSTFESETLVAD